jgi:TM2 domain-containing membrane protein YozV
MKNKTTAAILAFFLGGLGIHRFYLGQTGYGFLYLIFCWTFIPAIIAFIDFIIFLTMDEHSFNLKYNKGESFGTSYNLTPQMSSKNYTP